MKTHKSAYQHWIPESYLTAWRLPDDRQRVKLFASNGRPLGRKFARGLFRERDMYTRKAATPKASMGIDRLMTQIENRFGMIRPKLEAKQSLTSEEYVWLLLFVRALHARTPAQREHDGRQWGNVLNIIREMEQSVRGMSSDEKRKFARIQPAKKDAENSLSADQVRQMATTPLQTLTVPRMLAMVKAIERMKMTIAVLCAPPEHPFVTSDAPSIWYDQRVLTERDALYWPGMESKTFEINCPVSPTRSVIFTHDDSAWGYMQLSDTHAAEFNRRIVQRAHRNFVALQSGADPRWFAAAPCIPTDDSPSETPTDE